MVALSPTVSECAIMPNTSRNRTPNPIETSGEPPYDDDMEVRIAKLEEFAADTKERLVKIETRLEQTATKADLAESVNELIRWIVGVAIGIGVAAVTVMSFVLNNAVPRAPVQPQTPIIIYAQPAPAASLVAPRKD